mmetsp:Transcript_487/g.1588  ORF Transcript_487/g.1588 Transcript_487/m.1588 type:complete len:92 (-) Transcript_487:634-909(-)
MGLRCCCKAAAAEQTAPRAAFEVVPRREWDVHLRPRLLQQRHRAVGSGAPGLELPLQPEVQALRLPLLPLALEELQGMSVQVPTQAEPRRR